ncbi:PREDICTED: coagulation factor V [Gavialis gangeticus]|uniref:coagulation factor V n=1 Tax=Gavialis gangeticus TaxID=94835 RepID=UPI00092EAB0F|nr:PREDICTED: coagulation factor V [Gavialis gangeticus]
MTNSCNHLLWMLLGVCWLSLEQRVVRAGRIREHYIAAQITSWSYGPEPKEETRLAGTQPIFKKITYRAYDADFKKEKTMDQFLGLMGPTLRAEVGDTLVVHFKNLADKPLTIHPQGIAFNKQSEGALYNDRTSFVEKLDDAVLPGQVYKYMWEITPETGPKDADLPCLTYIYYSHENLTMDFNSGLIGALLICKEGSLMEDGSQQLFDREYVLMFAVFDESKSWQKSASVEYTINGYTNGTFPDLTACVYDNISWHLIGMSSKPEIFSVHFNGQTMEQYHHRVSTISLVAGAATTANMTVSQKGRWLISSLVQNHLQAGMHGYFNVEECEGKEVLKKRLSFKELRMIKDWQYFIAAEEITWDYAPNISPNIDRQYKSKYLDNYSNLIGKKYKKAVFKQYADANFIKRLENPRPKETGILGPVIRAQVKDKVKIVFKNMASRPYNIYFHGVTLSKDAEGANYPLDPADNSTLSKAVQPGETYTYTWSIFDTDQPTTEDSQCITRLYHSAVDVTRDIASGLIGPLLICKSESLDKRGVQNKADVEQQTVFAVFDENKSWYLEDNIKTYCSNPSHVKRDDPKFYDSNVMRTINGYTSDSSEVLGFCQNEVVQWHFSSIGIQDVVSIRISGHSFLYRWKYEDVLNLFPMSGESVTVEMNNVGTWLLVSWGSSEMSYGMRLRFRDAKCDSEDDSSEDDEFEMISYAEKTTKNVPEATSSSEKEEESEEQDSTGDVDYQDYLAKQLGLRTHKNNSVVNEERENLTALAIEQESGTDSEHPAVAVGLGLTHMNNSDTWGNDGLSGPQSTASLPAEGSHFYINYTSFSGRELLLSTSAKMESPDVVFQDEDEHESECKTSPCQMSRNDDKTLANGHLRTSKEDQTKDETELFAERGDGINASFEMYSSEEQPKGNAGREHKINQKRENQDALETLFYSLKKMYALLLYLRENKNASCVNSTSSPHSTQYAENISSLAALETGQLTNDNVDEAIVLEEEEAKKINVEFFRNAVNTTLALGNSSEKNGFNMYNLSELDIAIKKQETNSTSEHPLDNLILTPSPAVTKDVLEVPSPDDMEYPSKMTNKKWNLVSVKESFDLEANSAEAANSKLQPHFRNKTGDDASLKKQEMWKYNSYLEPTGGEQKGSSKHTTVRKREKTENGTLSASRPSMKIRRKKKGNFILTPRGVRLSKPSRPSGKQNCTLWLSEDNHTALLCGTNNTLLPTEVNHTAPVSGTNSTLTPRQFKPAVVIGVPKGNGEYEYFPEDFYSEHGADDVYDYLQVPYEDPYTTDPKLNINEARNPDAIAVHYLRSRGHERKYYIAAEEVWWDYAGFKDSATMNGETSRDRDSTRYKKVIFRSYADSTFKTPLEEGEYEEHLGILGPVIRAEVHDVIIVHFKNMASRRYSIHAHGLFYEKSSEGSIYEDESPEWFRSDDAVEPNGTYIYVWFANKWSGPTQPGATCKSWVYYSDVNLEKDINSGLIGPIIICQKGTLNTKSNRPVRNQEFFLLFMVFDEEKSWYFDERYRKTCSEKTQECHKIPAINGIMHNLQGLKMYKGELVQWHLLNMGGPKDIHVVRFHGQNFMEQGDPTHQLGVYPLLPGFSRTVEMTPAKPGIWLLDTEVGEYQQAGMQASYLVVEKGCKLPMGLESGIISDAQISASHFIEYWEPKLARLNQAGTYNAWSTEMKDGDFPWIQVDLQRHVIITGIQTQGAKQLLKSLYVQKFSIAYSKDKRKWITFKGNSTMAQVFEGNSDAYGIKENVIDPPIITRYIRVYPTASYNRPTLRMELLGCEIAGCWMPLGMENGEIKKAQITASSFKKNWYKSWDPFLARLNQKGSANSWQAKSNTNQQWLQIDLLKNKKITAIATQGSKSMTSEQFVKTYSILYSDQGSEWTSYMNDSSSLTKVFLGNDNANGQVKHFLNPPIISRFIRIIPKTWNRNIALRVELFGCDFS